LLLIAKKNGKSSVAAGIMVTALIMNERRKGEYLILAPTKDIADNSFEPAAGMIEADPALIKRYKPNSNYREIENRIDGTVLAVKAADADVIGGQNAISVLVDELWLFGKKASAENLLSEATGSLISQPEGFALYLSTQSDEPPAGVFRKKLQYHREVRDGVISDPSRLPLIYEYPEEMMRAEAWREPANFFIPNPSLYRSVDQQWLQTEYQAKEREGADSLRLFASKHLNVEIGIGLRSDRWSGAEYWERRSDPGLTYETLLDRSEVIVIGIDGGGLDDLFGLAVLGREKETKGWLLWSHAWCHGGCWSDGSR
jgi:phage terminase large subunit-like protein